MIFEILLLGWLLGFATGFEAADDKVLSSSNKTEFCEPQIIFGAP